MKASWDLFYDEYISLLVRYLFSSSSSTHHSDSLSAEEEKKKKSARGSENEQHVSAIRNFLHCMGIVVMLTKLLPYIIIV